VFSNLADAHASEGQLAFAKVNTDHVKDVAAKYGISAMPTFVFFENGVAKGVQVEGVKSRAVAFTKDGRVDRIRGADRGALEAVVKALASEK